jgi:hypothetical protein
MPDGSKLEPGATFSSIRESYADDEMYQACKKVYDATGETEDYKYKLHRFWHMGDAIMTYGTFALLYPEVEPYFSGIEPTTTTTEPTTKPTTAPTTKPVPTDVLWGDANCDGKVTIADAAAIFQHLANGDKYTISAEGKANADVIDNGKGLTVADGLAIQACDAGLVKNSDFPMTADEYEAAVK